MNRDSELIYLEYAEEDCERLLASGLAQLEQQHLHNMEKICVICKTKFVGENDRCVVCEIWGD